MKWVIFLGALFFVLPFSNWLRINAYRHQGLIWICVGVLPLAMTAIPGMHISPIGLPEWPGMTKGFTISALDMLAFSLWLSSPGNRHSEPFQLCCALYFMVVIFSLFFAQVPIASAFYAWQLVRMYLLYKVVADASVSRPVVHFLLTGMAVGLSLEAAIVTWERFGLGLLQSGGTLGHQNLLGVISHLIYLPLFALLLAGNTSWQAWLAPISGCVIAALTASRATLGIGALGLALIFFFSALREWTSHKTRLAIVGAIGVSILAPLAIMSLENRFAAVPLPEGYDEREVLLAEAQLMLSDHPMGIGINNFAVVSNTQGYADKVGLSPTLQSRSALVHNIYWLSAAETGYLGVAILIYLLYSPLKYSFTRSWLIRDKNGDLLLGFSIAMLMVYIHSYFEWIFFTENVQYVYAITVGMMVGLTRQERHNSELKVRADQVARSRHLST